MKNEPILELGIAPRDVVGMARIRPFSHWLQLLVGQIVRVRNDPCFIEARAWVVKHRFHSFEHLDRHCATIVGYVFDNETIVVSASQ